MKRKIRESSVLSDAIEQAAKTHCMTPTTYNTTVLNIPFATFHGWWKEGRRPKKQQHIENLRANLGAHYTPAVAAFMGKIHPGQNGDREITLQTKAALIEPETRTKVFSGSVIECLKHYGARLGHLRGGSRSALQPMAEFTGADLNASVYHWLYGKRRPAGALLLKVQCFLELNEYSVDELESLNPVVRAFGKLIAYGIIDLDEAATKELKYRKGREGFLRILRGDNKPSQERLRIMREWNTVFAKELIQQEMKWRNRFGQLSSKKTQHVPPHHVPDVEEKRSTPEIMQDVIHKKKLFFPMPQDTITMDKRVLVQLLADNINAMLPVARILDSEQCSAQDRALLRELTHEKGLFSLSTVLNRLCTAKAREIIPPLPQQRKEHT